MSSEAASNFPWKDDAENFIGCNLALADLINNLPRILTVDGRIHAETFVAASGCIAGFAAQSAFLLQKPNFSIDALNESSLTDGLFIVRSPSGNKYIFGDPLKEMIFCKGAPTSVTARLWERAAGGAQAAGLDNSQLPDTLTMWEHVTRSIQQDKDGMPSVPKEHWPGLPPAELLHRVWPFAEQCLTSKLSGQKIAPPGMINVDLKWWPTITGMVVCNVIDKVKDVLNPRTALIIAMETAIFTLKIDPARIISK